MFDVSFDYIQNVDSIQSPVSEINRDNTKKVNYTSATFSKFSKIFDEKNTGEQVAYLHGIDADYSATLDL